MKTVRVQVLIPTYNNVNEIEQTLDSVWKQTYNRENIYVTVVDFGSTDGTIDCIFSYNSYHLGIYQKDKQKNARLRVAEAAQILEYVRPGGKYNFFVLLYPGETMYPECLQKCAGAFVKHFGLNPTSVICEADIMQMDGTIIKQKPLYSEYKIIDGTTEFNDYIKHEYKHQVFEMSLGFGRGRYKTNGENNEKRFWNKEARRNLERNVIYLNEALVCTKEVSYEDEFEEILYRWESIISIVRVYTAKFGHAFNDDFEALAKFNLAEYALWRSWILYQKSGERKQMEDCFLISGVISPKIECSEIYSLLKKLLFENDITGIDKVNNYFAYKQQRRSRIEMNSMKI